MPVITLPDGSKREYPQALTVADVAASIGAGLAKAALAGRIDGRVVDTSFLLDRDSNLAIVTEKDADGLEVIRHSTAHLLAYAVKELFPEAQVTIGPVIENGFYYDFACPRSFTPDDLLTIEKRMAEIAKKDFTVTREVWSRDKAVEFFKSLGEHYKAELDRSGAFPAPIVTEISPLPVFHPAEGYHQNYYAENPGQGYCQYVIRPKMEKFRKAFADRLKR